MAEMWDCIVVGAGIIGSYTAYHLVKDGCKTLLLEQFHIPHTRGSSQSQSRLYWMCERTNINTELIIESYDAWMKLEQESGVKIFRPTGALTLERYPASRLREVRDGLDKLNVAYDWLEPSDLRWRYPMLTFDQNTCAIYDSRSGIILASKSVMAAQDIFKKHGGTLHDGAQVLTVKPHGDNVCVETKEATYIAKKVVLSPGPWARDLILKTGIDLPLRTMAGRQIYFRIHDQQSFSHESGMPFTLDHVAEGHNYQFVLTAPVDEYPGMIKVVTRGEPFLDYSHPDERDLPADHVIKYACDYVRRHMRGVDPTPAIVDPCVYTMTPDHEPIIDAHPTLKNVYIACGFSGHGFMDAPATTKYLSELVQEKRPSRDLAWCFGVQRFTTPPARL